MQNATVQLHRFPLMTSLLSSCRSVPLSSFSCRPRPASSASPSKLPPSLTPLDSYYGSVMTPPCIPTPQHVTQQLQLKAADSWPPRDGVASPAGVATLFASDWSLLSASAYCRASRILRTSFLITLPGHNLPGNPSFLALAASRAFSASRAVRRIPAAEKGASKTAFEEWLAANPLPQQACNEERQCLDSITTGRNPRNPKSMAGIPQSAMDERQVSEEKNAGKEESRRVKDLSGTDASIQSGFSYIRGLAISTPDQSMSTDYGAVERSTEGMGNEDFIEDESEGLDEVWEDLWNGESGSELGVGFRSMAVGESSFLHEEEHLNGRIPGKASTFDREDLNLELGYRVQGSGSWRQFSWRETQDVFYSCLREADYKWDVQRRAFIEVGPTSERSPARLRMLVPPLIQTPPAGVSSPNEYLQWLRQSESQESGPMSERHLVALLCSNAAALGIVESGRLVRHKVITAYTVRAKRGKAQLTHLRQTGGGGRMSVGGGLRARETRRLFERINEKLKEWEDVLPLCQRLLYSGNMRVWNEVYACRNPKPVIARDDARWQKVPISMQRPRLKELHRVWYVVSHGSVGDIFNSLEHGRG